MNRLPQPTTQKLADAINSRLIPALMKQPKIDVTDKLQQNHHHLSAIINRTKANQSKPGA